MPQPTPPNSTNSYLWCDTCRRSYRFHEVETGLCPVCQHETRPMGKFSAILRGLMSNEMSSSPLETRHKQLVRLIWTANGMGEQYFRVLAPDMPYKQFENDVTDLLCRGAEEGWVRFVIPPAPRPEESAYKLEFDDDERFVAELHSVFDVTTPSEQS